MMEFAGLVAAQKFARFVRLRMSENSIAPAARRFRGKAETHAEASQLKILRGSPDGAQLMAQVCRLPEKGHLLDFIFLKVNTYRSRA
jgi:hypothetical protein